MRKEIRAALTAGVLLVCVLIFVFLPGRASEPDAETVLTFTDSEFLQSDVWDGNGMSGIAALRWILGIGTVLLVSLTWILTAERIRLPLAAFLILFLTEMVFIVCKPAGLYFGWDETVHVEYILQASWNSWDSFLSAVQSWNIWDIGYLPYIAGGTLGTLMNLEPVLQYKLAYLAGALAYAAMCAAAVRLTPKYKMTFLCAAALPVCCFEACCYTYDTMVTAAILLGMALLVRILCSEGRQGKNIMWCTLVLTVFTLPKPVYSLCLLLLWMIPERCFSGKKEKWIFRAFLLALVCWCMLTLTLPTVYDNVSGGDARFEGADSAAQIAYILSDPVSNVLHLVGYFFGKLWKYETGGISQLGTVGNISAFGTVFLVLLLAGSVCTYGEERDGGVLTGKRRASMLGMDLLILFILMVTQYIVSSKVGGSSVRGMQPRYAVPIAILCALGLMLPEKWRSGLRRAGRGTAAAGVLAVACVDLFYASYQMVTLILNLRWNF